MTQNEILAKIGVDKVLHFAFGGWIACLAPTWYYAILFALIIGVLKECYDKFKSKAIFDCKDILVTVLGGCITAIFMLVL